MKKRMFLIDFDITISKNDSTDALLSKYKPEFHRELKAKYRNGEATMRDYIKNGIESLNITEEEFVETLKIVKIEETFINFVNAGYEFKIVSAGTKLNVSGSLSHYGIKLREEQIISNDIFFEGNKITVENPYLDEGEYYGVDKQEIVNKYKNEGYEVWFFGDGPSDYRAIEVADRVFIRANTRAIKHCDEEGIEYTEFNDFNEVMDIIKMEEKC